MSLPIEVGMIDFHEEYLWKISSETLAKNLQF
jgi:hypothetical protein